MSIVGIGIFNWIYKLEVEKVTRREGFAIPQSVRRLLTINLFLPLLAAALIVLLVVLTSKVTFR